MLPVPAKMVLFTPLLDARQTITDVSTNIGIQGIGPKNLATPVWGLWASGMKKPTVDWTRMDVRVRNFSMNE